MTGTFLNIAAVLLGTLVGVTLGNRLPERVRESVLNGLGLGTLGYAILNIVDSMSGQENVPVKFIIILMSLVVGAIVGELLNIDSALTRFGQWLERRFNRPAANAAEGEAGAALFIRGYIAATLLFCVGPMTILGSIQDGLTGDYRVIAIKSLLDMFAALAYASSLGIGVGFSVISILVIQGGISLLAAQLQGVFTDPMLAVLSAIGALLIIGISLMLFEIKRIRLANYLPALVIGPLAVAVLHQFGVQGF